MKSIWILTLLSFISVKSGENDLVSPRDLWKYITAVDKILNYCSENKFQVDMNMYHGLFLMKVFLNRYWNKPLQNLPLPVVNKFSMLVKKHQYLVQYFNMKVKEDKSPADITNKRIYTLMDDDAPWISNLTKFQTNAWEEPIPSDKRLEELYSTWDVYSKTVMDVFNVNNTTVLPRLFAKCLENIAYNPRNNKSHFKNCTSVPECQYLIEYEVDFGYIVTHKLVVLQSAHYGRHCYIFSKFLDEELVKRFCQAIYAEAVYIAKHDKEYLLTDLHMAQIMLCGLEGYADFLKKSWISTILKMQDPSGCIKFSQNKKRKSESNIRSKSDNDTNIVGYSDEWKIVKVLRLDAMEKVSCNVHTTGLAIATFGLAIRYILESLNVLDVNKSEKEKNITNVIKANKKHKNRTV